MKHARIFCVVFFSVGSLAGSLYATYSLYKWVSEHQPTIVLQGGEMKKASHSQVPKVHHCKPGILFWNDATVWTRAHDSFDPDNDWNQYLGQNVALGCIAQKDGVTIVIHGFVSDRPDDFLLLPSTWVRKIVWLEEAKGGRK